MTLYLLRVERRADTTPVEPLSRRIRLAASHRPCGASAPDRGPHRTTDGKRRTLAA